VLQADNRTAEVALLDESMRSVFNKKVPEFWRAPHSVGSTRWFEIAATLREKQAFSSAWFDRAISSSAEPSRKHMLKLQQAFLAEDWKATAAAADEMLRVSPESFDFYYQRAVARLKNGDDTGAAKDLIIFLKYCLDSEDYPDAVEMFHRLRPAATLTDPK
jgi:hypothetical protein